MVNDLKVIVSVFYIRHPTSKIFSYLVLNYGGIFHSG